MNKTIIIHDFMDANIVDGEWCEGLPLKYLTKPDEKLAKLLNGVTFKIVKPEPDCLTRYEVEIIGPMELISGMPNYEEENNIIFHNDCAVLNYLEELMANETAESYKGWIEG